MKKTAIEISVKIERGEDLFEAFLGECENEIVVEKKRKAEARKAEAKKADAGLFLGIPWNPLAK